MKALGYCRFCGRELVLKTLLDGSQEKYCPECDHVFFDEPSPAVIVAVTNTDRILLTRSVGWDHSYWGMVAGHIKSGETAEEAAVREVSEEVGLTVSIPEFLGTFALKDRNLLLIGFRAETASLDIGKSQELEKAEWFSIHEPLPLRPGSASAQIMAKIFPDTELVEAEEGIH